MKAFHGSKEIKDKYVNRVISHIKADNLVQGQGWKDGKGCAVGCTLEKYDHKAYEAELGIPKWLAHVEDRIFEGMSFEKSKQWPKKFLQAIKPGVDLNRAKSLFLIEVLKIALKNFDHEKFSDVKKSINKVIELYKNEDSKKEFKGDITYATYATYTAANAAADAANAAANAAPHAATYDAAKAAANAATYATYAAYIATAYTATYAANAASNAATYAAAPNAAYDNISEKLLKILRSLK